MATTHADHGPPRATRQTMAGRHRATYLALRLGTALRESREAQGLRQSDVARRTGISQQRISDCERGRGARAAVETWAVLAAAVGSELAAFLQDAPGADRPRDQEHLRRQEAVLVAARRGGWRAAPELRLDPGSRSRSIDVALMRPATREAVVVEVWDWLDDVGAAMRGLGGKVASMQARLGATWSVRGLFVLRDTHRNRALVREFREVFASRFPGSSRGWLRALGDPAAAMPRGDGLVWSSGGGSRLRAARLLSSLA